MKLRPDPSRGLARNHSELYDEYLNSPAWRATRAQALQRASWTCQAPGCEESHGLEVHHRDYANLGSEPWGALVVYCADCHEAADRRRRHARGGR